MNFDIFGKPIAEPKKPLLSKKQEIEARQAKIQAAIEAKAAKKNAILYATAERTTRQIATIETTASFRNRGLVMVDIYRRESNTPLNPNAEKNLNNLNGNDSAYNGYLSPATRRYVERMMSVWLTSVELNNELRKAQKEVNAEKVFPTFVTLTLPSVQMHTDNAIKEKILTPFITWLTSSSSETYSKGPKKGQKKGFGVSVYFWRAEPQKNTNIHFHIIADKYVPWEAIRNQWNQFCERLGYVTRYANVQKWRHRNGFVLDTDKQAADVEELRLISKNALETGEIPNRINETFEKYLKISLEYNEPLDDAILMEAAEEKQKATYQKAVDCGHTNPPSTEIRAIQNLDSVTAYVIKYVAKKPTQKPLAPNQELKFNDTLGRDCVYTYETKLNPLTNQMEQLEVNMQYYQATPEEIKNNPEACYKIEFEERKVNGRIWGCADKLRGFKPAEDVITETDDIGRTYIVGHKIKSIDNEGQEIEKVVETEKKAVPVMKYFTKIVNYREVIMTEQEGKVNIFVSNAIDEDQVTMAYIDKIVTYIGKDEVERISKEIGPSFEKMNGKIIPFRTEKMGYPPKKDSKGKLKPAVVKHQRILADNSPELHRQYTAYYKHIYNCLYGAAA
jgi:hypothetical protein